MGYYNAHNLGFFNQQIITSLYTPRTTAFGIITGIVDTGILDLLNTADLSIIAGGLTSKLIAWYPLVGGTSNTTSYNFMDPSLHQIGWFDDMTFTAQYARSGTGSGYGDTGIIPSDTLALDDNHMSIYSYNDLAHDGGDIGSVNNSTNGRLEMWLNAFGNTYLSNNSDAVNPPGGSYNTQGYFINNRVDSSEFTVYKDGAVADNFVVASNVLPNYAISICSVFVNGTERFYSGGRDIGTATIGSGLSNQNIEDLTNIMTTFTAGK